MKNNTMMTLVIALVVGAIAFFSGMQYQKMQRGSQFAFTGQGGMMGQAGARRFGGQGRNGGAVLGEIIASDAKSVTVKLQDGSSKIVVLSSTTSINKQASGSTSDLKTGERVAVFGTTNSDGSVTAQSIQLNPMFRGAQGGGTPQPSK